eukprot:8876060-Lingulodinium_polyedra.AAC.1
MTMKMLPGVDCQKHKHHIACKKDCDAAEQHARRQSKEAYRKLCAMKKDDPPQYRTLVHNYKKARAQTGRLGPRGQIPFAWTQMISRLKNTVSVESDWLKEWMDQPTFI